MQFYSLEVLELFLEKCLTETHLILTSNMNKVDEARCWAMRTGEVIVYPEPSGESYSYTKLVAGKKRKVHLNKCYLIVKIGNKLIRGKYEYKQDSEMTNATNEIYKYYYERYKQSERSKNNQ